MHKTILVIDDDPVILQGMMIVLKDAGYEVESSIRGEIACKKAQEYKPDIILLDVRLAGVDGRTLLKDLKHHKLTKNIPVIMISANEEVEAEVYTYGADDFIPKPFNTNQLLESIEYQMRK